MTWEVVVDTDTRRLIVLADAGWDGLETLTLIARHEDGTYLQGDLGVTILPLTNDLGVRSLTQVTLFSGERTISLDVGDLMPGSVDATQFTWQADATQSLTTRYDPEDNVLIFESVTPWRFSDIITLTVRDGSGAQASGQIVVQVQANDGSVGERTPDFRLAIIPNVFQPDFLDIFVISDMDLDREPLLRLQDEDWQDLPLTTSAPGIWFGDHTLGLGQEGEVQILALGIGQEDQMVKAQIGLSLGTVPPAVGKRLVNDQVSLYLPPDSFGEEAVVAVFPSQLKEVGPELVSLSQAYAVHSPQDYVEQKDSRIGFEVPAASSAVDAGWGIYRWDPRRELWTFAGAQIDNGRVMAPVSDFGRYALMADLTPPQLLEVVESGSGLEFAWRDQGSGMDRFTVTFNGEMIGDYLAQDDRLYLAQSDLPAGPGTLSVRAYDRAGNAAPRVEKEYIGTALPVAFELGQNFPNPFNPSTAIPFHVPVGSGLSRSRVTLRIYNTAGQKVRQLLDEMLGAGEHQVTWDANDESGLAVSSGLYVYRLQIGDRFRVRKMTLMR